MGNLLCIRVHAANIHDTKGGIYTFEKALYRYPTIQAGCADGGYRGTFQNTFDEFHNIRIDISMQIKEQKGLLLLYHVLAEKATGFAAFLNVGD